MATPASTWAALTCSTGYLSETIPVQRTDLPAVRFSHGARPFSVAMLTSLSGRKKTNTFAASGPCGVRFPPPTTASSGFEITMPIGVLVDASLPSSPRADMVSRRQTDESQGGVGRRRSIGRLLLLLHVDVGPRR